MKTQTEEALRREAMEVQIATGKHQMQMQAEFLADNRGETADVSRHRRWVETYSLRGRKLFMVELVLLMGIAAAVVVIAVKL